jgi:hypothetical protein
MSPLHRSETAPTNASPARDYPCGRTLLALAAFLTACICVLVISGCGAGADVTTVRSSPQPPPPASAADYSALQTGRPDRLFAAYSHQGARQLERRGLGPIWVGPRPGTSTIPMPDVETAREVRIGPKSTRVWISKGSGGGVCLLAMSPLSPPRSHLRKEPPVISSCVTHADLYRGTALAEETAGRDGDTHGLSSVIGIAPDGVRQVSISLAEGAPKSLRVRHNIYAGRAEGEITAVTFARGGVATHIDL